MTGTTAIINGNQIVAIDGKTLPAITSEKDDSAQKQQDRPELSRL
jgi:hypothetical protein